jgi:transcriptional regulator with XRE-family HTH domain
MTTQRRRSAAEMLRQAVLSYGAALAELVTSAKKEKDMTQKQLAHRSGVPLSRIRRYENGTMDPRLGDLTRLAYAMGMKPLDLCSLMLKEAGQL